jgi:hypothetical protein
MGDIRPVSRKENVSEVAEEKDPPVNFTQLGSFRLAKRGNEGHHQYPYS